VNAWASEKELRAGSLKRAGAAGCNTKNAAGRRVYGRLGLGSERGGTLRLWVRLWNFSPRLVAAVDGCAMRAL
jgi:hypothetical protein